MRKLLEESFALLLLAAEFGSVYGKVIVLHGQDERKGNKHLKRLLCVADDDGGALVWNFHLEPSVNLYRSTIYKTTRLDLQHFDNPNNSKMNVNKYRLNCMLNEHNVCMDAWATKNWKLVSSLDKPMGPVFDRRWEAFVEYFNYPLSDIPVPNYKMNKTGSVVFSVRGDTAAYLELSSGERYEGSFCYWTTIGGKTESVTSLCKCSHGLQHSLRESRPECPEGAQAYDHNLMSATEWRTFILSWNETDHSIQFYDREKRILRYIDTGNKSLNTNNSYYLRVGSFSPVMYRFHSYDYYQTSDINAVLSSPDIYLNTPHLCLQMVVGLCTQCAMEILLVDNDHPSLTKKLLLLKGSIVAKDHGLPMWQIVKINTTVSTDFGPYVHIKLVPKLEKDVEDRVWAIADVHECTPEKVIVAWINAIKEYVNSTEELWPNEICQKFSYDRDHILSATADVTTKSKSDDYDYCPTGKIGLHCLIDCKTDLGLSKTCLKGIICGESGCFCRHGLYGDNCDRYCEKGKYGQACAEFCDNCVGQNCDSITGKCTHGCNNTRNYHIPPFCKTEIVLPRPNLDFINETSAFVSLVARDEYKSIRTSYTFSIKPPEASYKNQQTDITANTKVLEGIFVLTPGSTYLVQAILKIADDQALVYSPSINITTLCTPSTTFEVKPHEISVTLSNIQYRRVAYPCPAKWYSILIEELSTGYITRPSIVTDFPLKFANLSSATTYRIKVYRSHITFFIANTTTLHKASSPVRNLRMTSVSSTHVQLQWDQPVDPNGVITKYVVQFEADKYLGCADLHRDVKGENFATDTPNTTITVRSLHPYTAYIISVFAYTSKYGERAEVYVTTELCETPTAVFSELRFKDYTLTWNDPVDCTTISGPIGGTKIIFSGISKNVISFYYEKKTFRYSFKLGAVSKVFYGAETYRVRVYVLGKSLMKYNETAYIELTFTTPPKAPPPVKDLERFELDTDAKTISIRWKEPQPPTNGQIEYYAIIYCNANFKNVTYVAKIPFYQTCKVWKNYICATVKQPTERFTNILVRAHNKNVSQVGPYVHIKENLTETVPSPPLFLESNILDGAVVELNWTHPWNPGSPFKLFLIVSQMNATNLRGGSYPPWRANIHEHIVSRYQLHYVDRLYLKPSSRYTLEVSAKSKLNGEPSVIQLDTPSCLAFENKLKWKMNSRNATIRLDIPRVLNDTVNSAMYVVIVGPQPCEQYFQVDIVLSQQIRITYDESAWVAALLSTSEYSGGSFTIGDNKLYGNATNCPLYTGNTYSVIVAVQSENGSILDQVIVARTTSIYIGDVSAQRIEVWVAPTVTFLVVLVGIILYWERRKRKAVRKADHSMEIQLS